MKVISVQPRRCPKNYKNIDIILAHEKQVKIQMVEKQNLIKKSLRIFGLTSSDLRITRRRYVSRQSLWTLI